MHTVGMLITLLHDPRGQQAKQARHRSHRTKCTGEFTQFVMGNDVVWAFRSYQVEVGLIERAQLGVLQRQRMSDVKADDHIITDLCHIRLQLGEGAESERFQMHDVAPTAEKPRITS
jgi:hypothetical protein